MVGWIAQHRELVECLVAIAAVLGILLFFVDLLEVKEQRKIEKGVGEILKQMYKERPK